MYLYKRWDRVPEFRTAAILIMEFNCLFLLTMHGHFGTGQHMYYIQ